jgi:hypothetical protein
MGKICVKNKAESRITSKRILLYPQMSSCLAFVQTEFLFFRILRILTSRSRQDRCSSKRGRLPMNILWNYDWLSHGYILLGYILPVAYFHAGNCTVRMKDKETHET